MVADSIVLEGFFQEGLKLMRLSSFALTHYSESTKKVNLHVCLHCLKLKRGSVALKLLFRGR